MSKNQDSDDFLPQGWERSYAGLKRELKNIMRSERAIWRSLKGGWYILYFLHLPLIIVLFLPLAVMTAILWPLGKLRSSIAVGITMGLMVPVFQLILSANLCTSRMVRVSVQIVDGRTMAPIEGAEVRISGKEVLLTDDHGEVEFSMNATVSLIRSKTVARLYCYDCFTAQELPLTVLIPGENEKTHCIRKLELGAYLLGNSNTEGFFDPTRNRYELKKISLYE